MKEENKHNKKKWKRSRIQEILLRLLFFKPLSAKTEKRIYLMAMVILKMRSPIVLILVHGVRALTGLHHGPKARSHALTFVSYLVLILMSLWS